MLLSHEIFYPEIPLKPGFPGISRRVDRWQRQAIILWLVAQGFSLRAEIQRLAAGLIAIDPRGGALMRVVSSLRGDDLLFGETPSLRIFPGQLTKLSLVRLSDTGRELMQDLGWQVHETEWERMQRLHEKGNDQSRHTAAVLAFVYQARLRGWSAGVMPELDAGRFVPDALVEKNGESYYVEVELGEQKASKWHNMARHQGVIAVCGRTPEHRKSLMEETWSVAENHHCMRLGTDLCTLFKQASDEFPLWLEIRSLLE